MIFNFPVTPSRQFLFNPTNITIEIIDSKFFNEPGYVMVKTTLVQNIADGTLIENRTLKMPDNILSVINGFNSELMTPTIDIDSLNYILLNFNLHTP